MNPNLGPRSSWIQIFLHESSKSTTEPFYSQVNRPELISTLRLVSFHIVFHVVWLLQHSIITSTNTTFPSNRIIYEKRKRGPDGLAWKDDFRHYYMYITTQWSIPKRPNTKFMPDQIPNFGYLVRTKYAWTKLKSQIPNFQTDVCTKLSSKR